MINLQKEHYYIIFFAILAKFSFILIDFYFDQIFAISTGGDLLGTIEAMKTQAEIDFVGTIKRMFYVNFYYIILIIFFKLVIIKNFLTASILSLIAWLFSIYFFIKILKYFKATELLLGIGLLLFCFWPSLFLYTTFPFKENFQVLFFLMVIYFFIRCYEFSNFKNLFSLLFSCFLLGMIHRGLTFYSLLIFLYSFIIFYVLRNINLKIILLLIFFSILTFIFVITYGKFGYEQFNQGLISAIKVYQNGLSIYQTRANYTLYPVNLHNFTDLILFIINTTKNYFIRPYLDEIYTYNDLLVFFENYLRIIIIVISLIGLCVNKQLIFLKCFLLFLGIELIWAIGTSNWGNAIRHHVPGLPIIIILFSISLKNIYEKFFRQ